MNLRMDIKHSTLYPWYNKLPFTNTPFLTLSLVSRLIHVIDYKRLSSVLSNFIISTNVAGQREKAGKLWMMMIMIAIIIIIFQKIIPFSNRFTEKPVTFTVPLKETVSVEGDTVTLECQISKANVEVAWLKDGKPVNTDEKHVIQVDESWHRLTLPSVGLEEEAEYTVQIGDQSTKAMLWVEGEWILVICICKPCVVSLQ